MQRDEEAPVVCRRREPGTQRARHVQLQPALGASARVHRGHLLHLQTSGKRQQQPI